MNTLKSTLLTIALYVLCFSSTAQVKPQIGSNFSNLSAPPLGRSVEQLSGYAIGVSYAWGNSFYIEPGLQYSTFGYKFVRTLDPDRYIEIKSKSARIPLMFGGRFMSKDNDLNIRAFMGPSFTWIFSEDFSYFDLEIDDRNQTLWGWNLGYGVDYKMVFFEIGYEFGLSNYFATHTYDSREGKNNLFWLRIGANLWRK